MSWSTVDEVPVDASRTRVYAEGWQSWSPATWHTGDTASPILPNEPWEHLMRFRPGAELARDAVQAEGLLVVDPGDGGPARWYGAPDPRVEVPSIRVEVEGGTAIVRSDGHVVTGATDAGGETALITYGDRIAALVDAPPRPAPTVWCTWYQYFENVTAADVLENVEGIALHDLAVDVIQIDDGWSTGLGEDLVPRAGFADLDEVVDGIRGAGRAVGIWLAPFIVGRDTQLARRHPDWLVGDAGRNWGQDLAGLDLTHPGVRDLLAAHLAGLRDRGVTYLKLDFLYGGALPGDRHDGSSAIQAYRSGLELIRSVMGPRAYLTGCGAPIGPSLGLVDAMRVSPDTFHEGGEDGSRGLRGAMALTARAWQQGRYWTNDPDCLVARPSYRLREEWHDVVDRFGGLRSVSDRVADLDDWGLDVTRSLLSRGSRHLPFEDSVVAEGAGFAAAARHPPQGPAVLG